MSENISIQFRARTVQYPSNATNIRKITVSQFLDEYAMTVVEQTSTSYYCFTSMLEHISVQLLIFPKNDQYYAVDPHAPCNLTETPLHKILRQHRTHLERLRASGQGNTPLWVVVSDELPFPIYREENLSTFTECLRCPVQLSKIERRQNKCPCCFQVLCNRCRLSHQDQCHGPLISWSISQVTEGILPDVPALPQYLQRRFDNFYSKLYQPRKKTKKRGHRR